MGYLFGSINAGFILGKMVKGIDIREHGSFNAGASNATIVLGWPYGFATAAFDILKALLPILFLKDIGLDYLSLMIVGVAIIVGHNYPFYMNFKGGKGTASFVGLMLGIHPLLGLGNMAIIFVVTIVTDYIVVGTMIAYLFNTVMVYFITASYTTALISGALFLLSLYKHRNNIVKIMNGEEIGLRSTLNRKKNR